MHPQPTARLIRGSILHFLSDPGEEVDHSAWEFFEDGALVVDEGKILQVGHWNDVLAKLPDLTRQTARYHDYCGKLITPGLIDAHVHYPQMSVIGSYGRQLLDWLEHYTFPTEAGFADLSVAQRTAAFFCDRLLAHGTTTASVYATVHPHSVDALFEAAQSRKLRMLSGKVMMDRNCPENLRDTAESSRVDCEALIERWHGKDRLLYTVTPRFAPTSTEAQLQVAGELFRSKPGIRLQSHLSENRSEIRWVEELFPDCKDYLAVYEKFGLLGPGAIYGHGIHLSDKERRRMAASGAAIAHCPTSNLFLGSGFFELDATLAAGIPVALATDVGGGTSLSMLRTMEAAYEVSQTLHAPLSAYRTWYLATLGGAKALQLDDVIGNFLPGKEADFTVWQFDATPELAWRMETTTSLDERLFAMTMMGDERCVAATHILGEPVNAWAAV
ncbi:MAG: guanine deaminase [Moraxellaceae bacterium]|nr:guanine deaminase [Moraxellaceae bacterium]